MGNQTYQEQEIQEQEMPKIVVTTKAYENAQAKNRVILIRMINKAHPEDLCAFLLNFPYEGGHQLKEEISKTDEQIKKIEKKYSDLKKVQESAVDNASEKRKVLKKIDAAQKKEIARVQNYGRAIVKAIALEFATSTSKDVHIMHEAAALKGKRKARDRFITPEEVQVEMNLAEENLKRAREIAQDSVNKTYTDVIEKPVLALSKTAKAVFPVITNTLETAACVTAGFIKTPKRMDELVKAAFTAKKGVQPWVRYPVYGAIALTMAVNTLPDFDFIKQANAMNSPQDYARIEAPECRVAFNSTHLTTAFMQLPMPDNNHLARVSALEGFDKSVSPELMFAVALLETRGGADVATTASSASGPYQTITATAMEQLKLYAKYTNFYKLAPKSTKNAINHAIALYTGDPKGFVENVANKNYDLSTKTALDAARGYQMAGELIALTIKDHLKNPDKIEHVGNLIDALHEFYPVHFLGETGATKLKNHIAISPNAPAWSNFSEQLQANKGLFAQGQDLKIITYAQFDNAIKQYINNKVKPFIINLDAQAQRIPSGAKHIACQKNNGDWSLDINNTTQYAQPKSMQEKFSAVVGNIQQQTGATITRTVASLDKYNPF